VGDLPTGTAKKASNYRAKSGLEHQSPKPPLGVRIPPPLPESELKNLDDSKVFGSDYFYL